MNVRWIHTAQQYLYSNNFPTCAIHITKICCNIHTVHDSRNFITFCSNEAGWNTASSCQNIKNIFVIAWGIICPQIISQTSAEIKSVDCINDLQVDVSDVPVVGIIRVRWLQCKWLPAYHTVAQSHDPAQNKIPVQDKMTFKIAMVWRE